MRDSGRSDCGPAPLGSDGTAGPLASRTHDIELMPPAARRLGVPVIIGSAGDTGTNRRVDRHVTIVRDPADDRRALDSFVPSREAIRSPYGVPDSRTSDHVAFDPALAIRFTLDRTLHSGSLGDANIFGSQQYGPLLGIMVP